MEQLLAYLIPKAVHLVHQATTAVLKVLQVQPHSVMLAIIASLEQRDLSQMIQLQDPNVQQVVSALKEQLHLLIVTRELSICSQELLLRPLARPAGLATIVKAQVNLTLLPGVLLVFTA